MMLCKNDVVTVDRALQITMDPMMSTSSSLLYVCVCVYATEMHQCAKKTCARLRVDGAGPPFPSEATCGVDRKKQRTTNPSGNDMGIHDPCLPILK